MSSKDDGGESGSVEVILPDGFGSSFSTKEIRAKVQCLYNQNLFAWLMNSSQAILSHLRLK